MKFLTKYLIHIIGINRCGQHAILGWLLGMLENVLFKNDMGPGKFVISPDDSKFISWPFFYYRDFGKSYERCKWEIFSPKNKMDAIILGSENASIEQFINGYNKNFNNAKNEILNHAHKNRLRFDELCKKEIFIPVIRSAHNHAASCLKWRNMKHVVNKNFSSLWISYAEEYLGITKKLPKSTVYINYDKWFSNKYYRKKMFDKMSIDVEYSEQGMEKVMPFGRGSSFTRMHNPDRAREMMVLERWKFWIEGEKVMEGNRNKQQYIKMINDPKLIKLSEQIFGKMPFEVEKK